MRKWIANYILETRWLWVSDRSRWDLHESRLRFVGMASLMLASIPFLFVIAYGFAIIFSIIFLGFILGDKVARWFGFDFWGWWGRTCTT